MTRMEIGRLPPTAQRAFPGLARRAAARMVLT